MPAEAFDEDPSLAKRIYTCDTQVFGLHLTRLDAGGRVGNACGSEATAAHFRLALHAENRIPVCRGYKGATWSGSSQGIPLH